MKIIIVVQNYPPEEGPVSYSKDVAYALSGLGNDITVITGLPHYPTGKLYKGFEKFKVYKTIENGVTVFRIPLVLASNSQPIKRIFGFITFIFTSLPFCLYTKKPDVFIISVPPFSTVAIGIITKLFRRKPVIMMLRDFEPVYSLKIRHSKENKIFTKIAYLLSKLYRLSDALIITHTGQLSHIKNAGLDDLKAKVIPHTINLKEFDKLSLLQTNNYFKKESNKLYAVYVGTMGKVHALSLLVKNLVCDEISSMPIEFNFFGSGEERDRCIEIVKASGKTNVRFFESVPSELVPSILKTADILILSSITPDNLGLKIYSYLSSGKPILFHGWGIAKNFLQSINTGWSTELEDKEMLIKVLKEICDSKNKLSAIGLNGRRYAEENFSFDDFGKKWNAVVNEVINSKKKLN